MDERTGKLYYTYRLKKVFISWIHAALVSHVSIYFSAHWSMVDNNMQKLRVTIQVCLGNAVQLESEIIWIST